MKKIGILTSGGDCPGLNAAIRGVAKASYEIMDCEIVGILDGFKGLIEGQSINMVKRHFSGILTRGGTILGTARTPFKKMRIIEDDGVDKVKSMVDNYERLGLDCLVTLGGNGTHKNANMLREEGLNIVALPKTIDNDIWGTEYTFGFHSAVDIATEVLDRVHTTADSHDRVMIVELMGHKAGWLTLYAGLAGGADVILIPEISYCKENVFEALEKRKNEGKNFSIIAVAEGAKSIERINMKKKKYNKFLQANNYYSMSYHLAHEVKKYTGLDTRVTIPGHQQRGGIPSAKDRILASTLGSYAAELIAENKYGNTVSIVDNQVTSRSLKEVAGKLKLVKENNEQVQTAKLLGVSFGEKNQDSFFLT